MAQRANLEEVSHPLHEAYACLLSNGLDGAGEALRILVNEASRIERAQHLQAMPYERSAQRVDQANGYKSKTMLTRMGEITFEVPQVRSGGFYPSALERGSRSEQSVNLALAEMYVQGVSTRKVIEVLQKLVGPEVSISSTQISRCAEKLDTGLEAWRNRPLDETPYLLLDARYERVREAGQVVDCAVLVAVGVTVSGHRRVLGVSVALSEAEVHWRTFLDSLIKRGLRGVKFIASDDHAGLKAARKAMSGFNGVAVNPATNKIYLVNGTLNKVTILDATTNATSTVSTGSHPNRIAVNPATNKIYVLNYGGNSVTVIDGASNATSSVTVGVNPNDIVVNPVTNKIYVANFGSSNVTVIDGATSLTSTVAVGAGPYRLAVNPVTNKIYVANINSDDVTVIDGASHATRTIATGVGSGPSDVAVNPVTNKIYVANNSSDGVTVIDGATNATSIVAPGVQPWTIAVNPVTNKIYVTNRNAHTVSVIDGATQASLALTTGTGFSQPQEVALNPVSNKIYVLIGRVTDYAVMVIDGPTNSVSTLVMAGANPDPQALAVNSVTNKIYVANGSSSNDLAVITEAAVQTGGLTTRTSITPIPGNISRSSSPHFSLQLSSTALTPIRGAYYQVDSWQGAWQKAVAAGAGVYTATPAYLQPGTHVLYAFAVDGEDATANNTGNGASPQIGQMAAYVFTIKRAADLTPILMLLLD